MRWNVWRWPQRFCIYPGKWKDTVFRDHQRVTKFFVTLWKQNQYIHFIGIRNSVYSPVKSLTFLRGRPVLRCCCRYLTLIRTLLTLLTSMIYTMRRYKGVGEDNCIIRRVVRVSCPDLTGERGEPSFESEVRTSYERCMDSITDGKVIFTLKKGRAIWTLEVPG